MTVSVGPRGGRVVDLGQASVSDGGVRFDRCRILVGAWRNRFGLRHVFHPGFLRGVRSVFQRRLLYLIVCGDSVSISRDSQEITNVNLTGNLTYM